MLLFCLCLFRLATAQAPVLFSTERGIINFKSDAPLEMISAQSDQLRGVINPEKKTFAFKVFINSFKGFNSGLQREHFNENYLESEQFQEATFSGKIVENINLLADGHYEVRAKGVLTIHGVEQERIIQSSVTVKDQKIYVESSFSLELSEFNIKIPKVVHQKIASVIDVSISAELKKR